MSLVTASCWAEGEQCCLKQNTASRDKVPYVPGARLMCTGNAADISSHSHN